MSTHTKLYKFQPVQTKLTNCHSAAAGIRWPWRALVEKSRHASIHRISRQLIRNSHIWSKETKPSRGDICCVVSKSRTEEEDPQWGTAPKIDQFWAWFFTWGPLPPGSWFGNFPTKKPPVGEDFFRSHCQSQLMLRLNGLEERRCIYTDTHTLYNGLEERRFIYTDTHTLYNGLEERRCIYTDTHTLYKFSSAKKISRTKLQSHALNYNASLTNCHEAAARAQWLRKTQMHIYWHTHTIQILVSKKFN